MKNLTAVVLLSLGAVLAGCSDDGGGGSVQPTSGVWNYTGGDIVSDTCEMADPPLDPDGTFTLTSNGDGTFTIDDSEGNVFDCTLDGSSYSCPERLVDETDASPLDAVVRVRVSITGSFSSSTAGTGTQTAHLSCEGADCATVATAGGISGFPCEYSVNFTANM